MAGVTHSRTVIRTSLCVTGAVCLGTAAPAPAHTIDVRGAAAAARTAAETIGQVDQVRCWRPFTAIHTRARHRAVCIAWFVHTAAGQSCTIFYEVRPAKTLKATQTFDPWCQ